MRCRGVTIGRLSVTGCSLDALTKNLKRLVLRVIEAGTAMTEVGLAGRVTEAFAL
jgi:hypothetical protein